MKKLRKYVKSRRDIVITAPLLLCFVTFLFNFVSAIKKGNIDSTAFSQLMTTVDGFGTVCSAIIMLVMRRKKK